MNNFIKFYNVFMDQGEHKLSPIKWYWLSLLYTRWMPFYNYSEVTISELTKMQSVYNNKNKPHLNKEKSLSMILELEKSGHIQLLNNVDIGTRGTNYDSPLRIHFLDYGNFEPIPKEIYELTTDPYELYVICCIHRIESYHKKENRNKGFEKKLSEWAVLLECGSKKAEEVITSLIEKKLIERIGWGKTMNQNGQWQSSPYEYRLFKQERTIVPDIESKVEQITIDDTIEAPTVNFGNWKGKGNLTPADFVLYIEQESNNEFIKAAESKIIRITSNRTNEKAVYRIKQGIDEARKKIEDKQRKIQEREQEQRDRIVIARNKGKLMIRSNNGNIDVISSLDDVSYEEFVNRYSNGYFVFDENIKREVKYPFNNCSLETKNKIYDKIKKMVRMNVDFTFGSILDLSKFKEEIIKSNNENRLPEEDWEGDVFDQYGRNTTKDIRVQKMRMTKKRELEQDQAQFYESLLES